MFHLSREARFTPVRRKCIIADPRAGHAHRFAITCRRELRNKRIEQSRLDEIPGIGPNRKRELLRAFGSLAALKKATPDEIAEKVPGLGETLAEKILAALG